MNNFENLEVCKTKDWALPVLSLCRQMLHPEREERPSADQVWSKFSASDGVFAPCSCNSGPDTGGSGSRKLIELCRRGDSLAELRGLLAKKDDRNTVGAIHQASRYGNTQAIRILLEMNSNINLPDHSGQTALHCAAGYSQEETVSLLLDKGAVADIRDVEGQTAPHFAAGDGNGTIIEWLLKKASVDVQDMYMRTRSLMRLDGDTRMQ